MHCLRELNESEMKRLMKSSGSQKLILGQLKSSSIVSTLSLPKATPSISHVRSCSYIVPEIPEGSLSNSEELACTDIGSGRFGMCTHMVYKDMFHVCVKQLSKDTSISSLKMEAGIMQEVSCEYVPHCYGICTRKRALIMSLLTINGTSTSLYSAVTNHSSLISTPKLAVQILTDVASGLKFIHTKGFLHNDLKLDNIVLGKSCSRPLRAFVVDFGKACKMSVGKQYHLSHDQKEMYKKEHQQIAPDLRDGIAKQSTSTDVYSFGRVLKRINRIFIHSSNMEELVKKCLCYSSSNRPTISEILTALNTVVV